MLMLLFINQFFTSENRIPHILFSQVKKIYMKSIFKSDKLDLKQDSTLKQDSNLLNIGQINNMI